MPNMHNNINMTSADESRTGRIVRGERFPIYLQTTTFLWLYRISLTSQNIIRWLKLPFVLTCWSLTPSGLILGLCDGLVVDSEGYLWTHLSCFLLCSLHLRLVFREKNAFSPTQCNRKHLPWCEMCPYRIHAEVERGVEEFYTLWPKLSSYNRNKAGMNSLMISESGSFHMKWQWTPSHTPTASTRRALRPCFTVNSVLSHYNPAHF